MTEERPELDFWEITNSRRLELGKKWKDVLAETGLSHETLNRWRKGYSVDPLTDRSFARALMWESGARRSAGAGRQPEPLDESASPSTSEHPPSSPLSPDEEALRTVVSAAARELKLKPERLDQVMRLARQDLEDSTRDTAEQSPRRESDAELPGTVRTDLSDIAREGRQAAGLSLEEVAEQAVDPASGERVIDAGWLDRLERNTLSPEERPEYPQLDALVDLYGLDPVKVQDAAGVQFHGVYTIWSEDGQVRGFSLWELSDPKDLAKARALMEEYGRAPQRRHDG